MKNLYYKIKNSDSPTHNQSSQASYPTTPTPHRKDNIQKSNPTEKYQKIVQLVVENIFQVISKPVQQEWILSLIIFLCRTLEANIVLVFLIVE